MWESLKIWLSDHWVETVTWAVVIAGIVWLASLLFGCAAHFYYVAGDIRQAETVSEQEETPALILEIPNDE